MKRLHILDVACRPCLQQITQKAILLLGKSFLLKIDSESNENTPKKRHNDDHDENTIEKEIEKDGKEEKEKERDGQRKGGKEKEREGKRERERKSKRKKCTKTHFPCKINPFSLSSQETESGKRINAN